MHLYSRHHVGFSICGFCCVVPDSREKFPLFLASTVALFHLMGYTLHCLVTHRDIWEVICCCRCCTAHAGQIKMMKDLWNGYHTDARTRTHTHTPHGATSDCMERGTRQCLWRKLPMVEQCAYFPSVFRSEDSRRRKTWHNKVRRSAIFEHNDVMYSINPECA